MQKTFFISDTHFGHSNIIKFEPYYRPYKTIQEHDAALVDKWNSVVNKNDIVWHLGDFAFGSQNVKIASKLNGIKKLVLGNHDTAPTAQYLQYFDKLYGCASYKGFILSHVPVHSSQFHRFMGNIHGHLHSKRVNHATYGISSYFIEEDKRYFNVSCEQIDCTPIEFSVLLEKWGLGD